MPEPVCSNIPHHAEGICAHEELSSTRLKFVGEPIFKTTVALENIYKYYIYTLFPRLRKCNLTITKKKPLR